MDCSVWGTDRELHNFVDRYEVIVTRIHTKLWDTSQEQYQDYVVVIGQGGDIACVVTGKQWSCFNCSA